jgi:hypothetical protein
MAGINEQSEVRGSRRRRLAPGAEAMLVTERDVEVVQWVYRMRMATRAQLQRLLFSAGGRSRCQDRLTKLYRNRYLDKLPDQPLNAPDVYYLSRRATRGLRLLRALAPDVPVVPHQIARSTVEHTLAIGSCRIALTQACQAQGYHLGSWQDAAVLAPRLEAAGLIPDAYFQIARLTAEGVKTASFWLEVERSGKTERALTEKIRRLGEFYYSGAYEREFGLRALRVLWLVSDDYGIKPQTQIARMVRLCRQQEVSFFRLAPLAQVLTVASSELLTAPYWAHPTESQPVALF